MDHPNNPNLNANILGPLDATTQRSMQQITSYLPSPGMQEGISAIPTKEQVRKAILQIESVNPQLFKTMLYDYIKTHARLIDGSN